MTSVDERVVQMKFDNKQFESGVSESEKTLNRFKKSLDFKGVEDSLKNLEKSFSGLDLSGLTNAIDRVADRFSPLGILGTEAMRKIADAAIVAGKKVADAFLGISDMSAGQKKYETQTKAVQTITNATGKSVQEVEGVLQKLQHYTDETSYDFAEMVSSIGKFTSVGVELERAEAAMEGIANEAAKSGAGKAEANRAMYNFAQALSSGYVKLIDWKSIENANMATKEFKETLIETAIEEGVLERKGDGVGTMLKQTSKGVKETIIDYKSFNETLSEEWLTSDVLIKTLEKYADTSKPFGEAAYKAAQEALTFSDALDAVKDAVSSGWMQTFKLLFGDLDEARHLWTDVANSLVEYTDIFASWRNEVLKGWHDAEGYNDMIEAASNLWQTFMNIVQGVGRALSDVFPFLKADVMTDILVGATRQIKESSASLLEMFGLQEDVKKEEEETAEEAEEVKNKIDDVKDSSDASVVSMTDLGDATKDVAKNVSGIETGLKRGMRGDNVKELQKKLVSLGFRLDKFGVDGIFGPETQAAVEELQKALGVEVTGAFDEATLAALNTEEGMAKLQERMHKGLSSGDVGKDVKDIQNELNKFLGENDKIVADGVFGPKTKAAIEKLQKELGVEVTGSWDDTTRAAFESSKMVLFSFDKIRKGIKRGDTSKEVKALQEQLIKTGYLTDQSVADGVYGPKTEEAVKKLQRELGVEETGVWDEATYHAVARSKRIEKANLDTAKSAEEAAETVNETSEKTEESAESADKATTHTTVAMMRLQNIVKGFSAITKIAAKFGASVVQIGGNILSTLQPLADVGIRLLSVFSTIFQNLDKELEDNGIYKTFVDKVTSAFKPFGETVSSVSKNISEFLDAYDTYLETTGNKNTYGTFTEFLDSYLQKLGPFGKAISAAIHLIGSLFSVISNGAKIAIKIGGMIFEVGKRIVTILSPIGSLLSTLFQAGVKIFEELAKRFGIFQKSFSESNSFTKWLTGLDEKIPAIQEKIQSFCDTILNFLGLGDGVDSVDFSKSIDNIVESIKNFFGLNVDVSGIAENIDTKNVIKTVKDKITAIYNGIKDWIAGFFSKDEDGTIKEGAMKLDGYKISMGVIGIAVALIAKQIYSVTNSFISIASNVSKIVSNIKGISKAFKNAKKMNNLDTLAGAILKFAGALGILAASVFVLAQLKWEQLAVGLTGLAAVIGMFIGSVFVLTKIVKDAKNLDEVAETLTSLGLAIGALSGSVVALSVLSWEALAKGLIGTAALLGMCLLLVKLSTKQPVDIKAMSGVIGLFVSLASALNMLTGVVTALGSMDSAGLIKGLLGVGVLLAGMLVFTKLLNGIKISLGTVTALFVSALAIDMVIAGFLVLTYAMKLLTPKDILKGLAGMAIIVLGIAGLLKLIEKIHPSVGSILALLPVAISLDLLILGFAAMMLIMRHASFKDVAKALGGMAIIVMGIAGLLKLIEKIHPSVGSILALLPVAISLDLLILGFMGLVYGLKNSSISDMLKAVGSLGALIISIGILTKLMEKAKPSVGAIFALIPVALALDLLIAGFVALALAMKAVGASALIKAVVALGAIVLALSITSSAIAKVNNGTQGIKAALTIIPLVIGLAGLAITFALFAKSMKDVSGSTIVKSIVSIGAMVLGINLLSKSTKGLKVKGIIGLLAIGGVLALLMYTFSKAMVRVKDIDASSMLSFATSLSELMLAMSAVGAIAGAVGPINAFLGIIAVAAGLAAVLTAFSALMSIPEVDAFLTSGAEKFGKLIGSFIGAMKAAEMSAFSKAINEMTSVGSVDQSKVDNAIAAAQAVADFGAGLPEKSLLTQAADFFFGSELKQFSGDMASFGKGFNSFATEITKIDVSSEDLMTKTTNAITIAESIKKFGESLEKKPLGEKIVNAIFGSELSQFTTDMAGFGTGFNSYAKQIGAIETTSELEDKTKSAITIATSIKDFGETLKEKTIDQSIVDALFGSELSQFSGDMVSFATGFKSYATQINKIEEVGDLDTKTEYAIKIAESLKKFGETFKKKSNGEKVIDAIFGSELSQFSTDMVSFSTGFNSYAKQMAAIESAEDSDLDTKTGYAITIAGSIKKFADGLKEKSVSESIADSIFGSELSQFSGDMSSFASKFNLFSTTMSSVTISDELEGKVNAAIAIAGQIKSLVDGLNKKDIKTKIVDSIFGSEFDDFSGDMSEFASKFNLYATTMAGITADETAVKNNTGTAITIATEIATFLKSLTEMHIKRKSRGIKAWFSDETEGETVISTVGELAEAMTNSASSFSGLANAGIEKDVGTAISSLKAVAEFLSYLSKDANMTSASIDDPALGVDKLQMLLSGLRRIAQELVTFDNQTKDLPLDDIAAVSRMISDFLQFGLTGADFDADSILSGINFDDINGRISEIIGYVQTSITQNESALNKSGLSLSASLLSAINEKTSNFKTAGENFVKGLTNGVYFQTRFAVEAAAYVARQMVAAVKNTFQTASPSKVTTQIGKYFSEGLSNGVREEGDNAVNSSQRVAENMMQAAKGSLLPLSTALFDDVDDNPVIRPVVDMSNVEAAKNSLPGYFNGQSNRFAVSANLANNVAGEFERQRSAGKNGFKSVGSSPTVSRDNNDSERYVANNTDNIGLLDRFDMKFEKLANAITNMQVVLDTGEFVGATSGAYDKQFGRMAGRKGRGN